MQLRDHERHHSSWDVTILTADETGVRYITDICFYQNKVISNICILRLFICVLQSLT